MNWNSLLSKHGGLCQYKPKLRSISSKFMKMCSRINSRRRERYGYKPILTSNFAFIQIHCEVHFWSKFVAKSISWWPKLPQILYRIAFHFCKFSKNRCVKHVNCWKLKLALWLGSTFYFLKENLVAIKTNANFLRFFSIIRPHVPIFARAVRIS